MVDQKISAGTYVGKLAERWQFPSDHLPIGILIDDLSITSWNVLNSKYMWWVTKKDSQGLQNSMLVDEHVYIGKTKLTIRDQHIVELILEMINHPTHPRNIIGLQECGVPFLKELSSRLPSRFTVIIHGGNGVILDKTLFEIIKECEVKIFSNEPKRSLQEILLKEKSTKKTIRLINVHIPGDPTKPSRFEFTHYLADIFDPEITTIAMGDMNFNELEMKEALIQPNDYTVYSAYCTNISPYTFYSKAIDHFIVHSRSLVDLNTPEQVLKGLEQTVELLQFQNFPMHTPPVY